LLANPSYSSLSAFTPICPWANVGGHHQAQVQATTHTLGCCIDSAGAWTSSWLLLARTAIIILSSKANT
jgi:hypothetical protein